MELIDCTEFEFVTSLGELFDKGDEGLDFVEQERCLARATRVDFQKEFVGIPFVSMEQREKEILKEKGIPFERTRFRFPVYPRKR